MKSFYLLLTLLLLMGSLTTITAQEEKWDGGFFIGAANTMGDLVESDVFTLDETNLAFGFLLKRNISQKFGLRLGLTTGKISGDDKNFDNPQRQSRGFSFENRVSELSLLAQWEPFGNRRYRGSSFQKILSPYLFAGVGLAFSNPTPNFNGRSNAGVVADQATDVQKILFTSPVGIGLRYDLNRKWNLGLEMGMRPVYNDYLDGVSQSANPGDNDWYVFGGLTLTTRFGAKDTDGDGITDENDDCPTVAGLSATGGCPDTDLDGIADAKDACPEVAGDAKFNGCPDTDGDGVADNQDNCPDVAGVRRFRGCPDTDGDGVADPVDLCPTVPGVIALDGCPDADGDGITDADDACPELAGTASTNGCPEKYSGCPDTDGDGIGDGDDKCPTNAGPAENDGCPIILDEDLATLELAMQNVRFRTNSDQFLAQSSTILNEIAEILSRYPNYNLKISGYTDDVGNDSANQSLSERRALACFQYLLVKNVASNRMSHAGFGETNPIGSNDSEAGRARNRRVEFELVLRNK
jgi:OmpA-OmpF porin, OOP family